MVMTQRLVQGQRLTQGQSLVMTPQLTQSIKLLAMSNLEIEAFVADEVEKNPLLELKTAERERDASPAPTVGQDAVTETHALAAPAQPGDSDIWDRMAPQLTLATHLREQIALRGAERLVTLLAGLIADDCDACGWLPDPESLRERLAAPEDPFDAALALVRSLEPVGVAARNLADCLALQLAARDRLDPGMRVIVENLALVAKADHAALAALSGLSLSDVADAIAELRTLDPKPGARFEAETVSVAPPDVLMRELPNGGWRIELNDATLPRVLVDRDYHSDVLARAKDATDKAFVSECLQTANWLVRSLDQRAQTILKVSRTIVAEQDAFFADGIRALRPMTLQSVADRIGMHESTVSRVTTAKTILTPRGLYPLKFFFTVALKAADGGAEHSAASVQDRIRSLVAAEGAKVLSDDAIVAKLRADGVDIARRTVAKYRDILAIPSSVQRRRALRAATLLESA